jgi:hypothetical protein
MEVLTAFVRQHAPAQWPFPGNGDVERDMVDKLLDAEDTDEERFQKMRSLALQGNSRAHVHLGLMYYQGEGVPQDEWQGLQWVRRGQERASTLPLAIQTILTVLGRRTQTYGKDERRRLDLSHTNLRTADLSMGDFEQVNLQGADLAGAIALGAHLQGALLRGANLQESGWFRVYLQGANLQDADLRRAAFLRGNFAGADLTDTNLERARLEHAIGLTQTQVNQACGDEHTKLPVGVLPPRPCKGEKTP